MWSVGCIFAEMAMQGIALFPGDSEIDQIFRIFRYCVHFLLNFVLLPSFALRILGTPTEDSWPGVSSLPDYKPTFPRWSKLDLAKVIPTLDDVGIDMLKVSHIPCVSFADLSSCVTSGP